MNDPELLAIRDGWMARLDNVCDGRGHGGPVALSGVWGSAQSNPRENPAQCVREQLISLAARRDIIRDAEVFRPLICGVGLYGVHYIDKLLGADVFDLGNKGNWQVHYLNQPVGRLEPPDWQRHPAWLPARDAALAFVESGAKLPCFDTPCLSSALNTAVNLYGQEFIIAMCENPDAARSDLKVITDLIVALHRWYRAHIPDNQLQAVAAGTRARPAGMGHICGCSTQLLTEELYREFIAPCEDAVLGVYPRGGMIHLCGAHAHLIPVWRNMKRIRIVQLNDRASADLPLYFENLREDQIFYSLECEDMPWQHAVEITGGRRLVLTFVKDDPAMRSFRAWKQTHASGVNQAPRRSATP